MARSSQFSAQQRCLPKISRSAARCGVCSMLQIRSSTEGHRGGLKQAGSKGSPLWQTQHSCCTNEPDYRIAGKESVRPHASAILSALTLSFAMPAVTSRLKRFAPRVRSNSSGPLSMARLGRGAWSEWHHFLGRKDLPSLAEVLASSPSPSRRFLISSFTRCGRLSNPEATFCSREVSSRKHHFGRTVRLGLASCKVADATSSKYLEFC